MQLADFLGVTNQFVFAEGIVPSEPGTNDADRIVSSNAQECHLSDANGSWWDKTCKRHPIFWLVIASAESGTWTNVQSYHFIYVNQESHFLAANGCWEHKIARAWIFEALLFQKTYVKLVTLEMDMMSCADW